MSADELTSYVALLRGVNVGGKNAVNMRELIARLEDAGFGYVRTYINSGNILFRDARDAGELGTIIAEVMEHGLGVKTRAAVISSSELQSALEHAPEWWGADKASKHDAMFVIRRATAAGVIAAVGEIKPEYERVYVRNEVIFWSAPLATFSRTRWSKASATVVYQDITVRGENTARRLAGMAAE